jgi:hypothetical protein
MRRTHLSAPASQSCVIARLTSDLQLVVRTDTLGYPALLVQLKRVWFGLPAPALNRTVKEAA